MPHLSRGPVEIHDDGWDCLVLEVGNTMAKFPRFAAAVERLRNEARTLAFAANHSAVPIPKMALVEAPELAARGGPPVFSVHEAIRGTPLAPPAYDAMGEAAREALARDVARTYAAFHRADPTTARRAGVPHVPRWPDATTLYGTAETALEGDALRQAGAVLAIHETARSDTVVFGHFDTHGWNMALGVDHRLRGLFDFGHAGIGALHRDLSYPCFVAPDLAVRVARIYRRLAGRAVSTRRLLNAHAVLRLVELHEAAPDARHERARAFVHTAKIVAQAGGERA